MSLSAPSGLPDPARDRASLWVLLGGLGAGIALVVIALIVVGGSAPAPAVAPAPAAVVASPPVAAPAPLPTRTRRASIPAGGSRVAAAVRSAPAPVDAREKHDEQRFAANDDEHVRGDWVAGFYPIYERAQKVFGVSWLLLASVHKQETAFSTHPTTYRGLNFANCCAGPMQFNVTNGPQTTWDRFRDAHKRGGRPVSYPHRTRKHPSVYDDFDAIMAGAWLLGYSGAGAGLDGGSWRAAYDYYGHDLTGIDYASQVVARAIGWSRNGFCINCEVDPGLVASVDGAWGAPVRAAMVAADEARAREQRRQAARRGARARVAQR